MTGFDAIYYDGRTSGRRAVRVSASERGLHIAGTDVNVEVGLADVSVDPPVGATRRILHLPGGAQLQTDDGAAVDSLYPRAGRLEGWVHRAERRWKYALAALVLIAGCAWWAVVYGLPVAARLVATLVPSSAETALGEQALAALDKGVCGPTQLESGRQRDLGMVFETLTAGLDDTNRYRLHFRACPRAGPNAFALPGGAIVLTDGLVKLAENDRQVAAVLAHEIGHVRHRHVLRQTLQALGLTALVTALAGDAVSITSLAVALPTALLESGYSREFENEADGYAFQRLKEVGLSPRDFAAIMTRLDEHRAGVSSKAGAEQAARKDQPPGYLSTHPATAERIRRALENQ